MKVWNFPRPPGGSVVGVNGYIRMALLPFVGVENVMHPCLCLFQNEWLSIADG